MTHILLLQISKRQKKGTKNCPLSFDDVDLRKKQSLISPLVIVIAHEISASFSLQQHTFGSARYFFFEQE